MSAAPGATAHGDATPAGSSMVKAAFCVLHALSGAVDDGKVNPGCCAAHGVPNAIAANRKNGSDIKRRIVRALIYKPIGRAPVLSVRVMKALLTSYFGEPPGLLITSNAFAPGSHLSTTIACVPMPR
jgi:hypothetical protein